MALFVPLAELGIAAALVQGRDEIERFWKAGIDSGVTAVDLTALEVAGGGGRAYEIGRYSLRLDGGEAAERGAYVFVHERQGDGRWRRTVEMFNSERSPQ